MNPVELSLAFYLNDLQRYFQRVRTIFEGAEQSPCVRDLSVGSMVQTSPGLELQLTEGKRLVYVSELASAQGLRLGDKVVSVVQEVLGRDVLESTALVTLTVVRGYGEIGVQLVCRNSRGAQAAFSEVLSSASRGDWPGCLAAFRRLGDQLQFETSGLTALRLRCVTAKDIKDNPADLMRGREVGATLFRIAELLAEEARSGLSDNKRAYDLILGARASLDSLEFYDLADEIERRFLKDM